MLAGKYQSCLDSLSPTPLHLLLKPTVLGPWPPTPPALLSSRSPGTSLSLKPGTNSRASGRGTLCWLTHSSLAPPQDASSAWFTGIRALTSSSSLTGFSLSHSPLWVLTHSPALSLQAQGSPCAHTCLRVCSLTPMGDFSFRNSLCVDNSKSVSPAWTLL